MTLKKYSLEGLANKLKKCRTWMQEMEHGDIDVFFNNLAAKAKELGVSLLNLLSFSPSNIFNNCIQSGGNNESYIIENEDLIKIIKSQNGKE